MVRARLCEAVTKWLLFAEYVNRLVTESQRECHHAPSHTTQPSSVYDYLP
jgi:hypothetical protein